MQAMLASHVSVGPHRDHRQSLSDAASPGPYIYLISCLCLRIGHCHEDGDDHCDFWEACVKFLVVLLSGSVIIVLIENMAMSCVTLIPSPKP